MNKKILKTLSVAFSVLLAGSLSWGVANTVKKGDVKAAKAAAPETFGEFTVGGWISFYNYNTMEEWEAQVEDLARSGHNLVMLPASASNTTAGINKIMRFQDMPEYDAILNANNMKMLVGDHMESSNIEEIVTEVLLNDYQSVAGYFVGDEPSASGFESAAEKVHAYLDADPSRYPYVNLYPSYAGTAALGGTYEDYLRNWVKTVGAEKLEYLSYDHYPWTAASAPGYRNTFFSDIETLRKVAYENGRMKTGMFVQSGYWNGMRMPTVEELRWQTSCNIAYGSKTLYYFCWAGPDYVAPEDGGEGMRDFIINPDGSRTELYEPAQRTNWQLRQLGPTLMSIDPSHAYHTGTFPQGAEKLPASFFVQPTSQSSDFIISLFTNKDDTETYIMLVNKSTTEEVTASFNVDTSFGIEGLTEIRPDDFDVLPDPNGKLPAPSEVKMDMSGGRFTDTFKAGSFKLYRVEGDFRIPDPATAPEASVVSGNYTSVQEISLKTTQTDVDLYYTLDGSYPRKGNPGTYLYNAENPIFVGEEGKARLYSLRTIATRKNEESSVNDYYYFVDATGNKGEDLVTATTAKDWTVNGVSGASNDWTIDGTKIELKSKYNKQLSNRGITYNKRKYDNVSIEMTFNFRVDDGVMYACHPGIGLHKSSPETSLWNNDAYYAIVEPAGRVASYDGNTEYGPRNISAMNFNAYGTNTLKVVSYNGFFSIAVNGVTCYTLMNEELDWEEGYISILSSHMPICVQAFYVKELGEETVVGCADRIKNTIAAQSDELSLSTALYTPYDEVVRLLPVGVNVLDSAGNTVFVKVKNWRCEDFDRKILGQFLFVGEYETEDRTVNVKDLTPSVRVELCNRYDKSALIKFIEIAESLNEKDYEEAGWAEIVTQLAMARETRDNEFVAEGQITVAVMRLSNAISGLKNVTTNIDALSRAIEGLKAYETTVNEKDRLLLAEVGAEAKEVLATAYSTQEQIDAATTKVNDLLNLFAAEYGEDNGAALSALRAKIAELKALNADDYGKAGYEAMMKQVSVAESYAESDNADTEVYKTLTQSLENKKNALVKVSETNAGVSGTASKVGMTGIQILMICLSVAFVIVGGCFGFLGFYKRKKNRADK